MSKVYFYYEVNKVIATKITIENILHNIFLKYVNTWHAFIYITIGKLIP